MRLTIAGFDMNEGIAADTLAGRAHAQHHGSYADKLHDE